MQLSKPEGVQQRNRSRAHCEDIAQNAAYPGRRTLVGFNERGVIMRFHLEDHTEPIANIDRTSVFAWSLNDTRPCRRQFLQVHARAFVRAVLGPHHGKHPELRDIRLTPKNSDNFLVFIARQIMLSDEILGNRGHAGLHHDLAITATRGTHVPVVPDGSLGNIELAEVAQATEQDRRGLPLRPRRSVPS
jgi:hypothetical protein